MTEKTKFIIVKGDVSGIQDFIFNVKSNGAARELKGRSFFIKLLVEVAMKYLLDKFGIEGQEIKNVKISTSGGNFIIKLPYKNDTDNLINSAQQTFTRALQNTGLNLSLVWITYDADDYSKTIRKVNANTRERKLQFFNHSIDFFEPKERTDFVTTGWKNITEQIKNNKYFKIDKDDPKAITLTLNKNNLSLAGFKIAFSKNDGIPLKNYLESLFPIRNNGIIEFENLAKYGSDFRGVDKLGILLMDVDGLGNAIGKITDKEKHKKFDEKLQSFFNIELGEMINHNFQNKIYTVTAGGDDSFFVGKWNTILDLAIKIQEEFDKEFKPEGLTISAGLIIVNHKFPIVRFANLTEKMLKKAKYSYNTKGNICLFNEVLQWDILKNDIGYLRDLFRKERVSGGILAKARLSAIKGINEKTIKLEDFWQMGYYLRDMKNKRKII